MVKHDQLFCNANGSSLLRMRLVFVLCRLWFMCCMILIRVSHPAQQGLIPPTLGIRNLGGAASSGCLWLVSTHRLWDTVATSWVCVGCFIRLVHIVVDDY